MTSSPPPPSPICRRYCSGGRNRSSLVLYSPLTSTPYQAFSLPTLLVPSYHLQWIGEYSVGLSLLCICTIITASIINSCWRITMKHNIYSHYPVPPPAPPLPLAILSLLDSFGLLPIFILDMPPLISAFPFHPSDVLAILMSASFYTPCDSGGG